ncbi:MAG: LTA synthase family protein [Spirochaetes bacterium]|nr:LTA synthase family protein [Spirochaetota bacterium]
MNKMPDPAAPGKPIASPAVGWLRLLPAIAYFFANFAKLVIFNRDLVQRGTRLSNVAFIVLLALSWELLVTLTLATRRRWLAGFYLVQLAYMAVNAGYFHYYNTYLSFRQAFRLLGEFSGLVTGGALPFDARLLVYVIDLPFIVLLLVRGFPMPIGRKLANAGIACSLAALALLFGYKYSRQIAPGDVTVVRSDKARFIANFGLLPLQATDFFLQADYERQLSPEKLPEVAGSARKYRKSVLFLQVEALDANAIAADHGGKPVMPFLRSLSARGRFIPYMLSYHKGGGTSDTEFSAMTSLEPLDAYAAFNLPDYAYPNSMPRLFREEGYSVEAFHGNIARYWNRGDAFASMGFETYWSRDEMRLPESGWGAKDDDVLDFVAGKIEAATKPFFYFVITMSSHGPYRIVPGYYADRSFDDVGSNIERRYLLSMAYVDKALERFFLRMGTRLDDVIVILYGDHAEYYVPSVEWSFPRASVHDDSRRLEFVPCIVFAPGAGAGEATEAAVLTDLAPTALAASGIPYRFRTSGKDLLDLEAGSPTVSFSGHAYERADLERFALSTKNDARKAGR